MNYLLTMFLQNTFKDYAEVFGYVACILVVSICLLFIFSGMYVMKSIRRFFEIKEAEQKLVELKTKETILRIANLKKASNSSVNKNSSNSVNKDPFEDDPEYFEEVKEAMSKKS